MKLLSNRTSRLDTTALRKMSLSSALFLLAGFISCMGQGTLQITFDGPPAQPSGTGVLLSEYVERGMFFSVTNPVPEAGDSFILSGGGIEGTPENGTAYIQSQPSGLLFRFIDDSSFGLRSLDLAGYSDVLPDIVLDLVGYRSDGSTLRNSFTGTGIGWRTVYFNEEWASGLSRVEIPGATYWSIDNVIIAVPEPASGALLACGAFAAMLLRKKR